MIFTSVIVNNMDVNYRWAEVSLMPNIYFRLGSGLVTMAKPFALAVNHSDNFGSSLSSVNVMVAG